MAEGYSIPERRGLPNWLAAVMILAALGGAIWFAWTNLVGSADGRVVAIREGPAPDARNGRAPRPARPQFSPSIPEGVNRSAFGRSIYARVGNAAVRGIPDNAGRAWDIVLEYFDERTWVTPEQWRLVEQTRVAMSLPHRAREVGLTAEQKAKLDAANREPQLSEAERGKVMPMFAAWQSEREARGKLGEELKAAAAEITARHQGAAKEGLTRFLAEIPRVLTPEQIEMIRQGTRPRATSRPVI